MLEYVAPLIGLAIAAIVASEARHRTEAWWLAPVVGLTAGYCAYYAALIASWAYALSQ